MTYKELIEELKTINKEQLAQDVTVYAYDGEYYRITKVTTLEKPSWYWDDPRMGILGKDHIVLATGVEEK